MICDKGHIFCKMCILEYLIKQKKQKDLKNKKYEDEKLKETKLAEEKEQIEKAKKIEQF